MITSTIASHIFVERIIERVYKGTCADLKTQLSEGFGNLVEDPVEVENWFLNIDENHKEILLEILKTVVIETIFGFLVSLDNASGGPPIRGQVSDFAVYLQTYENSKEESENRYQESIRFNSIKDEDLHDLFMHLVLESGTEEE